MTKEKDKEICPLKVSQDWLALIYSEGWYFGWPLSFISFVSANMWKNKYNVDWKYERINKNALYCLH